MNPLYYALASAIIISLISLVGVFTLGLKEKFLNKILLLMVGLSAGALMGGALLHMLPEAIEESGSPNIFLWFIAGFSLFFVLERIIHWHHCHEKDCPVHTFAYINLVGDGVHNFIDGFIIITSFMVSVPLGIAVSISVIFHEIPQEIGDFGVLVYAGVKKTRALLYNFLIALTAILGVLVGYFLGGFLESNMAIILAFAGGGFIYIAASDLIPELHKEEKLSKSLLSFAVFILGIALMWGLKFFG